MKIPRIEKWVIVQLTDTVVCGQVYNHLYLHNGLNFYTKQIYGIKGKYVVCEDGVFELGEPDKVWVNTDNSKVLKKYEL